MKASKNAFIGYTYQEQITFLFLAIMDVKREIISIEMEADVDFNFDDIIIALDKKLIYCQIKDFDDIKLKELNFSKESISIKGKNHFLSDKGKNVLFFKSIDIKPNDTFFGLPAYKKDNVFIISLSRGQSDDFIDSLYQKKERRRISINRFFIDCLDNRILKINRNQLPIIDVFDIRLIEKTIDLGRKHLKFSNILFIEGKPGVGKSHYVNTLSKVYKESIIYRFWVSNQDKNYKARLGYESFLFDISKKIFGDYLHRQEEDIIQKISVSGKTVIIDGLDHVENYNSKDLKKFVGFIEKLQTKVRTIVLSRPLKFNIVWQKQILGNWNKKETHKITDELYHIKNYSVREEIYKLTRGYPILVRFIGEHYKVNQEIPKLKSLTGINDYYNQILENVNTKIALTLFLTSQSFFMKSEFKMFLEGELLDYINEFIKAYPYLFEIRLNRVSLFHDSFNKFLRESNIDFSKRKKKVNNVVYRSILEKDRRFMSRVSYFELNLKMKEEIIKKFSSIDLFKELVSDCIDFEAMRSFYNQLRELLGDINHNILEIKDYYDLSLVLNIVLRDHISTVNEFLYTYVKCLLFNGYTIEDITSSGYLFSMFVYYMEKDATLLYNITNDSIYDTTRFFKKLEEDIYGEEIFFEEHKEPIKIVKKPVDYYLKDDYNWREHLTYILTNLYIHKTNDESLLKLQECVKTFIDKNEINGVQILQEIFQEYNKERTYPQWVLNDVRKNLLALGRLPEDNQYLKLTLKDYILENSSIGSFDMWVNILSYLRLSIQRKQKIDLSNIGLFWCMYGRRKDYTVINIDLALKAFEESNLILEKQSIKQIVYIQSMSEKGIRHLLTEYVSIHSPKIIETITKYFNLDDLNISWFNLPASHISQFSDRVFNYAIDKVWYNNRFRREVDFKSIINVLDSSKWIDLINELKFFKYKIWIRNDAPEIKEIEKTGIGIVTYEDKNNYHRDNVSYRYNKGILDSNDKEYIVKNNLSIAEVSGCVDGNYSSLVDLDLYKLFSKEEVSENLQLIFYNALLGKVHSINHFGNLFHFVGSLPKMVKDYTVKFNMEELLDSYNQFMELSLLKTTPMFTPKNIKTVENQKINNGFSTEGGT